MFDWRSTTAQRDRKHGALLWDEVSEADARNNLSTTMSRLRQVLPFNPLQTVAIDPTAFPGWFRLCARNLNTGSAKVTLIMSGN